MATVVPWTTPSTSPGPAPSASSPATRPVTKPSAGSAGVEGVLVLTTLPVAVSSATTSVKVPPVSMPTRILRGALMGTSNPAGCRSAPATVDDGAPRPFVASHERPARSLG